MKQGYVINMKKIKQAVGSLEKELASNPDNIEALGKLGIAHAALDQPAQAETMFRRILALNPAQPEIYFHLALACYSQKKYKEAILFYRQALSFQPNNAMILNNLGLCFSEINQPQDAIECYHLALQHRPNFPDAYFNLGNALYQLRCWHEAVESYQKAVTLRPDYSGAFANMATSFKKLKRYQEAELNYRQAIALTPHDTEAYIGLGIVLQLQENYQEAAIAYKKALVLQPNSPTATYNLGITLHKLGDLDGALIYFKQALAQDPTRVEALNNLGLVLTDKGNQAAAIAAYEQAITYKKDFCEAYSNLGNILLEQEKFDQAIETYHKALTINPTFVEAWYNLGKCYSAQNNDKNAIEHYRQAISINQELAEAHWNLSHSLLLAGKFHAGFQEYLWRWKRKKACIPNIPLPEWHGEQIPEHVLLIHTEQGIGDTLQFIRYLPMIKKRVGSIHLACEKSLLHLFASLADVDKLILKKKISTAIAEADYHVPLLNLPTIFATTQATIPQDIPYLTADQALSQGYEKIFAPFADKLKIGIVWQGNPQHKNDHNRSCRLEYFASLFTIASTAFFSLQKGQDEPEPTMQLTNLAPYLESFANTAAIMTHLDLIISVDTSVVHLAGALGRPCWTLLPFVPDWRWLRQEESSSPWYPTMRLFRQTEQGNWQEVFKRLKKAVEATARERRTAY